MKNLTLVVASAIFAIALGGLVWRSLHQQPPLPPSVLSRAEQVRLDNIARQKKDGIIAPARKSKERSVEELASTRNATPSRDTSLTLLNPDRVPTEDELIKSGQLSEPLSPTGPADPEKMSDPVMKNLQSKDNQLFGRAMNAWNRQVMTEALPLFVKHLKEFPRSPWAAEAHLHLGLASLQQGYPLGCLRQMEIILKGNAKGTAVYQKAMLLKAKSLQEWQPDEAAKIYSTAMSTETDARRRSTAASWLVALSQRGKK